ncbi:hypothetical protein CYMTET_55720 [Cymbomonas tetramitiformis]|uniref:Uncharacterized protein n=1 Tax=Cymbomonas tetramitiformis TaxID=36881 RepID=A0AAE0ENA6_9CHLO|nr:hypothetical protein CYMTET_55720 [Cymbomonas tetramitiformis]
MEVAPTSAEANPRKKRGKYSGNSERTQRERRRKQLAAQDDRPTEPRFYKENVTSIQALKYREKRRRELAEATAPASESGPDTSQEPDEPAPTKKRKVRKDSGVAKKTEVQKCMQNRRACKARKILQPVVETVGKMFGKGEEGKVKAISAALERRSGSTCVVNRSENITTAKMEQHAKRKHEQAFKAEINDPELWDQAYTKANLTMSQGRKLAKVIFRNKRGYKSCDNRIIHVRKTKNEVVDLIIPITETASAGGHQVDVHKFFSLVLPTYFNRLSTRLHPSGELTPEDEKEILSAITEWNISFDARTSKSHKHAYTSFVASPKIVGLEDEWQSPHSCWTILEMEGKDKASNLTGNCKYLFKRIQELEDGQPIEVVIAGKPRMVFFRTSSE